MTYDAEQEDLGWHRYQLGGFSDAAKTQPTLVLSVAVIPTQSVERDDSWFCVQRFINGQIVRTVELMQPVWFDGISLPDAYFVDCGQTYSGAATTTISGLTWLIGQTVSVLADGSVNPDCVVGGGGVITLSRPVTKAQIGFSYVSSAQTMRIEAGGSDGTAQGKMKRIHKIAIRLYQTVGLLLTASNGTYYEPFRSSADKMDNPVALYTGDKLITYDATFEIEGRVSWQQVDPLPNNVVLLTAQLETHDGV